MAGDRLHFKFTWQETFYCVLMRIQTPFAVFNLATLKRDWMQPIFIWSSSDLQP